MSVIDVDALFEKFVKNYMKDNAGRYSAEEWEDKIPELYEEFGSRPLAELGGRTPKEYYAVFDGAALVDMLAQCAGSGIPISDYLCEAIVGSIDTEAPLLKLLDSDNEELLMTALNLLGEKNSTAVLPLLINMLAGDVCEHVKELCTELLSAHADDVRDKLVALYYGGEGDAADYCEILSHCAPDERVAAVLIDAFETHPDEIPFYAGLLARFGDASAISAIEAAIPGRTDINDLRELRFAIEALGGEPPEIPGLK